MQSAQIEAWLEQNRDQARTGGITAVDLLELPDELGQLMRLIIAAGPVTPAQLHQAISASPNGAPWADDELRQALRALCDCKWLQVEEEQGTAEPRYGVNFRTTSRAPATKRSRPILDFDL